MRMHPTFNILRFDNNMWFSNHSVASVEQWILVASGTKSFIFISLEINKILEWRITELFLAKTFNFHCYFKMSIAPMMYQCFGQTNVWTHMFERYLTLATTRRSLITIRFGDKQCNANAKPRIGPRNIFRRKYSKISANIIHNIFEWNKNES